MIKNYTLSILYSFIISLLLILVVSYFIHLSGMKNISFLTYTNNIVIEIVTPINQVFKITDRLSDNRNKVILIKDKGQVYVKQFTGNYYEIVDKEVSISEGDYIKTGNNTKIILINSQNEIIHIGSNKELSVIFGSKESLKDSINKSIAKIKNLNNVEVNAQR